jgi:pyruvate/2-oxoglutarate dehydrogenase complex dihydrolipoamide dehydrogenase (E3) component
MAAKTPARAEMKKPVEYYEHQLKRLGVRLRLGITVGKKMIEEEDPEEIILAAGGLPKTMAITGAESGRVVQGRDVLLGRVETGKRVVVLAAENGHEGLGTAEFLADRGKSVEVLIPQFKAGQDLEKITGFHLFYRLNQKGIVLNTRARIEAVKGRTVIFSKGAAGGQQRLEEVDTLVLCLGSLSNDALLRTLGDLKKKVHPVGQCRQVGGLFESISDGLKVGLEI